MLILLNKMLLAIISSDDMVRINDSKILNNNIQNNL